MIVLHINLTGLLDVLKFHDVILAVSVSVFLDETVWWFG